MDLASGIPATQSKKIQGQCGNFPCLWQNCGRGTKLGSWDLPWLVGWNLGHRYCLVLPISVNMVGFNTHPAYSISLYGRLRRPGLNSGVFPAGLRAEEDGP